MIISPQMPKLRALSPDSAPQLNQDVADPLLITLLIDAPRPLFCRCSARCSTTPHGVPILLELNHNIVKPADGNSERKSFAAVPRDGTAGHLPRRRRRSAPFDHFGCKNSCVAYNPRGGVGRTSRGRKMVRGRLLGALALLLAGTMGHAADTPPAAATTPPTAEQFGRLPFMEAPQLSPDGTRVATQIALNGQLRLAIITLGDIAHLKLINPGAA
jgi:hypothetical protein